MAAQRPPPCTGSPESWPRVSAPGLAYSDQLHAAQERCLCYLSIQLNTLARLRAVMRMLSWFYKYQLKKHETPFHLVPRKDLVGF